MIILIAIEWYLIGLFGGLWVSKKIDSRITNGDLVILSTLGGVGGPITFLIGLAFLPKGDWWDKEVF
jgi:hypothetical protein